MWPRTALLYLVAELSSMNLHGIGSSHLIIFLSDMLARRGHLGSAQRNLHSLNTKGAVG
jgi:hypothetical protein